MATGRHCLRPGRGSDFKCAPGRGREGGATVGRGQVKLFPTQTFSPDITTRKQDVCFITRSHVPAASLPRSKKIFHLGLHIPMSPKSQFTEISKPPTTAEKEIKTGKE